VGGGGERGLSLSRAHPVDVVQDDLVGRLKVETRAPGLGADEEHVALDSGLLCEALDHLRTLVVGGVAV